MKLSIDEIFQKLHGTLLAMVGDDPALRQHGARLVAADASNEQQRRWQFTIDGEPYSLVMFAGKGKCVIDFTDVNRAPPRVSGAGG